MTATPSAATTAPSYRGAQVDVAAWLKTPGSRPTWIRDGRVRPEARQLIDLVRSAAIDGLDPAAYRLRALEAAVRRAAAGRASDIAKADFLLSQTLISFARDQRSVGRNDMAIADAAAIAPLPSARMLLSDASEAHSLAAWIARMPWMNPAYVALRQALVAGGDARRQQVLRVNLNRARALPGALYTGRYVIVDAAAARLTMVENGFVMDEMKVVVGRTDNQTPMVAGVIRYAILNPYWNVPPDLAATRLAPHVVSEGVGYLARNNYEVLSDWSDAARPISPKSVDWVAAAAGRLPDLRMRQLPGPDNSMGRMKFMFPNTLGIYLHDTDDKSLFDEPARMRSGGCIRLQNAAKLGRWLYGKPLTTTSNKPEQRVELAEPVPVYVTYLTAAPEEGEIVFRDDFYNRDGFGARGSPQQAAARS